MIARFFLFTVLIILLVPSCDLNGGNVDPNNDVIQNEAPADWKELRDSKNYVILKYPPEWEALEEVLTDTPFAKNLESRIKLNPPDYSSEYYDYLLTIDVTKLSISQNQLLLESEIPELTNQESFPFGEETGYRYEGKDKNGVGRVMLLLPHPDFLTYRLILRTDDPDLVDTLDKIYEYSSFITPDFFKDEDFKDFIEIN